MDQNQKSIEEKSIEMLQEKIAESPLLNVEPRKSWIILYISAGLILALLLWSIFGRIPIETIGRSVSISAAGIYLIDSPSQGILSELYVAEGQHLLPGMPLAKINNPKIASNLSTVESTKFKIENLHSQSLMIQKALAINLGLYDKGLIAKMTIDQTRSELMQKNIEIEDAHSALAAAFSELELNSFVDEQKFRHYRKLLEAPAAVIDYVDILNNLSTLSAPSEGHILEVIRNPGEPIKDGESLFWIERPTESHAVIFYGTVGADNEGRIRPGLKVLIEPANVNNKEYGAIVGTIKDLYTYPVSEAELMQNVGNKQIVEYLLDEGKAVKQVSVIPKLDPTTQSGFKWTSKNGPPYVIPKGTVAKMRIIVDEQPPISYLIPLWKINPQ